MWHFATSMRPVTTTLVIVAVAVVAVAGGFAGGWLLRPTSTASTGPASLAIIAAGSLQPARLLPALASAFVNVTPGVTAPTALQEYEGSTDAATTLESGPEPYDAFVAADFRVIPQHLETVTSPDATWEVVFAADPMVLAYNSSVSALSGISATNWYSKITATGVTLGTPNASSDPLGAAAIFTLELEDGLEGEAGALYGHFFSGGEGALAVPTSATKIVSEDDAGSALAAGDVDVYLIYRSYAVAQGLTTVTLSSSVDLGNTSSTAVSAYGGVTTTVLSGTSTKVEAGAPVLFSLTVPTRAPDALLGLAFAEFLLSNATASTWAADGFLPLAPLWTDSESHLPAALSGSAPDGVAPLPSYLSALLT